jgi:hypothetical protein
VRSPASCQLWADTGDVPVVEDSVADFAQARIADGAFPEGLEQIHGLVSHGFLRRYRWTIDFTRMTMRFAPPG